MPRGEQGSCHPLKHVVPTASKGLVLVSRTQLRATALSKVGSFFIPSNHSLYKKNNKFLMTEWDKSVHSARQRGARSWVGRAHCGLLALPAKPEKNTRVKQANKGEEKHPSH